MKKLICLLLAAIMLLGIFAGCGKTTEGSSTTATEKTPETKPEATQPDLTGDETGKQAPMLQAMVDALVFIPGSKGGNAVIVKSDVAKAVFALCNQRKDGLKGTIMPASVWKKMEVDVLHAAVAGKEFTISYADEDETTKKQTVPATESTSTEPATK